VYEKQFWMEMICQSAIYFSLGCEKGGLCLKLGTFNEMNTPKLNHIQIQQKRPIFIPVV